METRYVIILDFWSGYLNIIHLTQDEIEKSKRYDNFENFLVTLEDKYEFNLSNSQWMTTETLQVYHYENGREVNHA